MATYQIRNRDTYKQHDIEADSMEGAVLKAYRADYGKGSRLQAIRVTGLNGMSGVFQVYAPQAGALSSVGPNAGYHAS